MNIPDIICTVTYELDGKTGELEGRGASRYSAYINAILGKWPPGAAKKGECYREATEGE